MYARAGGRLSGQLLDNGPKCPDYRLLAQNIDMIDSSR
jgi:hypothetical protein